MRWATTANRDLRKNEYLYKDFEYQTNALHGIDDAAFALPNSIDLERRLFRNSDPAPNLLIKEHAARGMAIRIRRAERWMGAKAARRMNPDGRKP
jgi:hypothetical protein